MPDEIEWIVDHTTRGYAHDTLSGRYVGQATVDDLKERFYHPFLGGRNAAVVPDPDGKGGTFSVTVHTD